MIMGYFAPLAKSDLHDGRHTHTLAEENGIFQFHGERAGVSLQLMRSACPYHVRHSDRVADQDHIDSRLIDAESLEQSKRPHHKNLRVRVRRAHRDFLALLVLGCNGRGRYLLLSSFSQRRQVPASVWQLFH